MWLSRVLYVCFDSANLEYGVFETSFEYVFLICIPYVTVIWSKKMMWCHQYEDFWYPLIFVDTCSWPAKPTMKWWLHLFYYLQMLHIHNVQKLLHIATIHLNNPIILLPWQHIVFRCRRGLFYGKNRANVEIARLLFYIFFIDGLCFCHAQFIFLLKNRKFN